MDEICRALSSHGKLDRDRGLEKLSELLKTTTADAVEDDLLRLCKEYFEISKESTISFNKDKDPSWEQLHGALHALKIYISLKNDICSINFYEKCLKIGHNNLNNSESRVRIAAGELLGDLTKHRGVHIYTESRELLLSGIRQYLDRTEEGDENMKQKLGSTHNVFHDTAGWGNLETNMKALECVIKNADSAFNDCIDKELLDLIFNALSHTNRFVRETGYMVCSALVSIHPLDEGSENKGQVWTEGKRVSGALEKGLADNWSQVRMSACCATRAFLLGIPNSGRDEFYPQLLPPLCLNRYYIAEGVRLHCQATWRMLFSVSGVKAVEKHLSSIVPFYVSQSEADNHAVREAACACIAELATKVGTDPVKEYVPILIKGLLVCFEDDSWPVRDAACVACGNFVSSFPEESKPYLEKLMPLFYTNLEDNIPSVRQGAAIAISTVTKSYLDSILSDVLEKVSLLLEAVSKQADDSKMFSDLSKKPAVFGVAMADDPAHTNQVMYSCGSLAPKMGRGGAAPGAGGCSASHHFKRPAEPWEITDGAVRLYTELCDIPIAKAQLLTYLTKISDATRKRNFDHHKNLLETIFKLLPIIFRRLTKNKIKPFLSDFLDGLYYGLKSDMNLLRAASVECLQSLSLLLGPNILRGRVEMFSPDMLLFIQSAYPETIGC